MCGRYTLTVDAGDLAERFGVDVPERYEPRYNAAPRQSLPVIRTSVDVDDEHAQTGSSTSSVATDAPTSPARDRELAFHEWGLVPSWVDEPDDANHPINARSETVREKRSFREAFARRRCLVPADGFYEWTDRGGGKQPYRVTLDDESVFAMAGLHEVWEGEVAQSSLAAFGADGDDDDRRRRVESFTVLTTDPNDAVADLHHRMAVVLHPDDEATWLHGDPDDAAALLEPYDGTMRSYPVSTAVNDPANESPGLLDAVDG
ncbi:SOS response-associated peptidase [Halorubellus sp. PRR65]|uniref:SOS response-associated peptidase n=1 Tax=Halorubellus sp. PRR65 TaxID=3098148 RepID=UPI002B25C212|nr:SOS response-associated peptidase [Halorubellus sp. PRR65]